MPQSTIERLVFLPNPRFANSRLHTKTSMSLGVDNTHRSFNTTYDEINQSARMLCTTGQGGASVLRTRADDVITNGTQSVGGGSLKLPPIEKPNKNKSFVTFGNDRQCYDTVYNDFARETGKLPQLPPLSLKPRPAQVVPAWNGNKADMRSTIQYDYPARCDVTRNRVYSDRKCELLKTKEMLERDSVTDIFPSCPEFQPSNPEDYPAHKGRGVGPPRVEYQKIYSIMRTDNVWKSVYNGDKEMASTRTTVQECYKPPHQQQKQHRSKRRSGAHAKKGRRGGKQGKKHSK